MLSTEKSLYSPWPTVSSLSLSTWPAPTENSSDSSTLSMNNQIVQTKKQWKKNFVSNFTSSSEASPTFQTFDNFSFDNVGSGGKDVNIGSIDELAAKLLHLSEQDHDEGVQDGRPGTTPSPHSSNSEININIPTSSSNPRSTPDLLASASDRSDDDDTRGENARFKTEICRNFKEKGHCLYGDLCQFAHGKEEMRNVGQHSKYKTKRCQKYWIAGYCAYGPRCNFLHYEEKDQVGPKHGVQARDSGGAASLESGCTTPSMSPPNIKYKLPSTPVPLEILYRPSHGSGRLAALTRDGEFFWIDTRLQKYV